MYKTVWKRRLNESDMNVKFYIFNFMFEARMPLWWVFYEISVGIYRIIFIVIFIIQEFGVAYVPKMKGW